MFFKCFFLPNPSTLYLRIVKDGWLIVSTVTWSYIIASRLNLTTYLTISICNGRERHEPTSVEEKITDVCVTEKKRKEITWKKGEDTLQLHTAFLETGG